MSDQPSSSTLKQNPGRGEGPYVVEHYGFAAPAGAAPSQLRAVPMTAGPGGSAVRVSRPTSDRRRRTLAAGALGLVLATGIGGVAAAAADLGPDGRGDGGRGAALVQARDAGGSWGDAHRRAGLR
jgi:hypothetical protein